MPDSSSSETNVPVSEWSTGTLKIYHDDKITAVEKIAAAEILRVDENIRKLNVLLDERSVSQEKAITAALRAAQEAVDKSDRSTEKRFESVNEFRRTLSDQTNTFVPRAEYEALLRTLSEKVGDLTVRVTQGESMKQGSDVTIGKIYGAIGVVGAILGILVLLANGVFN